MYMYNMYMYYIYIYIYIYIRIIYNNIYVLLYSFNMGTSGLPDIYTQSTRAAGSRAEGVYIRQTTSAHVTTVMYHLFIGQKPT